MEFRLLGPLEAVRDGTRIPLTGRRQRSLLAALLFHANTAVTIERLARAVWDTPPVAPTSNLRTGIAELRRKFRAAGESGDVLTTVPGGYRLTARPRELDLLAFADLAARGEAALGQRDLAAAATLFGQALALWRGVPLTGEEPGAVLRAEVAVLVERRAAIAERYTSARIELGESHAVLGYLRSLVTEHPLREELWAQLMIALHRCDRPVDALDTFTRARRHLGDVPSLRLHVLRQDILAGNRPL
ncbi:AfsR/SARP family transcriptional regulator [Amycolatopsis anabasis]|uniref:AfsR/SARP family transcriptional regulator n=1 Tax=Amycolatopsis anabasis TaxID=1840409 RepID=UPI00131C7E66|nr:AfsR/SARP family transcriptional regulator [Amycolatopsis anabasis]